MKDWCITRHRGGYVQYRSAHRFMPYETLILKRPMYYCNCGLKISPLEYIEYSKYLTARNAYIRSN